MKTFANWPNIQYAIIRASSKHDSPELLVLAYVDDKSLRSLIAKPSIVALGFVSRSAAEAAGSFHQRSAYQHMHGMQREIHKLRHEVRALRNSSASARKMNDL